MAQEAKFKMSAERYAQIQEELDYLQTVREKEVAELIKEARSFGDLSENSEYDEAKTEQGKLYSKIAELQNLINNAEIVESKTESDKISLGSTVTVYDVDYKEERTYKIVGSQEADPMDGRLSDESPVGAALMGRKRGDKVLVEVPSGKLRFEIKDIHK